MFNQLLPQQVDNNYRGYKSALWLFATLLFIKVGISLSCIFNGRHAASSADGIPLETFTSAGAQVVVSLFALWGLSQLMLCSLGILVLVRYRSMISFMFALLLLEQLSRKLILQFLPVVKTQTLVGSYVNLLLLAVMIVGLALSILSQGNLRTQK